MIKAPQPIKGFDCVKFMRDARARIDAETEGMPNEEFQNWLDSRQYEDPWLQEMADRARAQRKRDAAETETKSSVSSTG